MHSEATGVGTVTITGSLAEPREPEPTEPEADELLEAVVALRTAGEQASWEPVQTALLAARNLLVEISDDTPPQLVYVFGQGIAWLPVYTTRQRLADWMIRCGRATDPVRYSVLPGRDLVAVVAQLPERTGLVLDPGSDHVTALPIPEAR